MECGYVTVLGECGYDTTISEDIPRQQEHFRHQIRLARKFDVTLCLHIRGRGFQEQELLRRALAECTGILRHNHAIYLHCSVISPKTCDLWRGEFENVYFGISKLSLSESSEAILDQGMDTLIFETDSPYFPISHKDRIGGLLISYRKVMRPSIT